MQEGQRDFIDSCQYLTGLVKEIEPDLLHLNHLCYGGLPVKTPRIVVAHGNLISWWEAVGREPEESRWLRWYRDLMTDGLSKPTWWWRRHYGCSTPFAIVTPSRGVTQ